MDILEAISIETKKTSHQNTGNIAKSQTKMDHKKIDHPNRSSIESAPGDQSQNIDEEIEACVTIMNKPHACRTEEEIEMFAAKVASLQIFGRSLFENLEPKAVISKLMPFMKHEHFSPGQAIFNYEQPSDKMYIILRGKAKELIPKTIDEIEAESHIKYGSTVNWPLHMPAPSISEISRGGPDTPTSGSSMNSTFIPQKGLHSSLTAISEENNEENENLENAKKRFRKLKAVLPFLKKINGEKTTVTNAEEYRYKKSIKKNRSILRPILSDDEINREVLEAEFGASIVKEFMKFPRAYFIGGILKVRFSKYLYPGGQCGIRAMRDNSLRSRAVFAEEDCHCLSLHRDDFAAVIESEKALNSDKIEYFKKLFNMYDHRVVSEFSLLWENMMYKTNDIIYHQNEPSDYLYLLASGQVMFTKTMSEARKPKQFFSDLPFRLKKKANPNDHTARVATISEGYFFGEQDFFEEQPHELTSVVISNKARVYRISLAKYKSRGKNYSDIMREIRRLLTLKTTWKNERLKDITEKHQQAIEIDKQKVQENIRDIDRNLLGLLSPDSQQASSNRLKLKVMEKAKAISATSPALDEVKSPLKIEKSPTTIIKTLKPKIYEVSKSTGRLIPDYRFIVQPKRNKLDHLNSARPEGMDQSETSIFNRTRLPIQYNSKCEDLIKKDTEIVRLNFKENLNKRPGSQRIDSRRGLNRPNSQARDGGITSSASLNILRKRVMNSGVTGSLNDLRDFNEGRHNRAPSIDLDTRVLVTEQDQHSVAATINAIPSLTDKHFRKFILANIKQNPQNTEKVPVVGSLDQLDKPEKAGSMNIVEGSTKNTLTKTTTEIGSLNRIMDEMVVSKHVSSNSALSPIHSRPKTRTSTQNLRATLQRRGSWKVVGDSMNIHVSKDNSNSWQKSFRIQGENKSRTRYLTGRSDVHSLTNIKMAATVSDLNGIVGQSLL